MTPADRYARVTALFHDALEQPPGSRAAWLADACDDPDVRHEVAALLAQHTDAGPGLLDRPALAYPDDTVGDEADPLLGECIGAWRVTGLLGRGGMGAVYRAERVDDSFAQHAALKLVHPAFLADFRPRFLRERALLAGLHHPGIAHLLDGGVAEGGAPYLAMELVDGAPITAYATAHGLSVRERLALFIQACEAVAYAHRNLVVHRDLKPDHILVEQGSDGADAPRVKLLDFGIAKLLAADGDSALTQMGGGPMTPSYAAPEQLLGRPATTAADVYALGVVLYELLAGRRPYELGTLTAAQAEHVVCEETPPPPSAVASAHARALRGDLDTIVLKALAKEPERRYASAEALAADLRRHLDGLPVEARPATLRYRAGRFARRHYGSLAVAAAGVLLVAALTAFYTVRLIAERDRAESASVEARDETDRAEAVAGFLEQILRAPNARWYVEGEARGPETPIRAVLDEAAARVDRDFADQPDLLADLHHVLGDTYSALGLVPEGWRHHLRSLVLRESLYTPPHPAIAEALYYVASAIGPSNVGEHTRLLERAVAMQRARNEGNNFPFMVLDLASNYSEAGRYAEAEALSREGIAFVQTRFVPGDDGFRYRDRILILLLQKRADALSGLGEFGVAAHQLTSADSVLMRLPRLTTYYEVWQNQMCSLGRLLLHQRRYAEAEPPLLACHGELPPRAPAAPFPRPEVASSTPSSVFSTPASVALAELYETEDRPDEAARYRAEVERFRAEAARSYARLDSIRAAFQEPDSSD